MPKPTYDFPDELIERLSYLVEGQDDYKYEALIFQLEVEGYDVLDPDLTKEAIRRARLLLRERRAFKGVLGRFSTMMLTHGDIAEHLGMPRSTVQAIACGRVRERFTAQQREALRELVSAVHRVVGECLADL
jgi:hypothetical protein